VAGFYEDGSEPVMGRAVFKSLSAWVSNVFRAKDQTRYCGPVRGPDVKKITISGIPEHCTVLGYCAASSGNSLLIDCPETSVRNYHYSLCNNPEQRRSHLLRGRSLKSHMWCT
jgi:hypothetical protein